MSEKKSAISYFTDQLWTSNQVLVAILGICSALAVTTGLKVALTMGVSVALVTACSCFLVSLLRHWIPSSVRMIAQLAIISTAVSSVDQLLKAFQYDTWKGITVYVALIITNCIVMGRTEGMAKNVSPIPAFLDGLGAGLGYAFVLFTVGFIRELFGFGTLFGYAVIPASWYSPTGYMNNGLMVLPPSAFVLIGLMIWGANAYKARLVVKK